MATEIERGGMDLGGPHEPSYYEIALTNRQVVVAFIVLLVCLVAAFFSGVWIGRESSTRALAQFVRATPPASPGAEGAAASGTAAERPDGQALQEFKFFNDQKKPPTPAETRAARRARERALLTPSAATPEAPAAAPEVPSGVPPRQAAAPAAPPSGAAASRSRTSSQASAAAPEPSGEGEPLPAPARPAASAAGPAAAEAQLPASAAPPATSPAAETPRRGRKSAATPGEGAAGAAGDGGRAGTASSPATTASAATAANAGAAGAGGVVIQVFSSADKVQADKIRERLAASGQPAFLSPIEKAGQTMYRVRIGPFPSREKAEKVADQVRREQKLDTWITPK
jgi:cell division septation protein DedD